MGVIMADRRTLRRIAQRYRRATKKQKARILDEFVETHECTRNHASWLLRSWGKTVFSHQGVDSGRTLPVIPANVTTESGQPYQRFRGKPSNFGWLPEWVVGMTGMDRCASASLIEQASGSPQQRGRRSHGQREDRHAQDQRHYSSAGQRARLSTDRACADIASGGDRQIGRALRISHPVVSQTLRRPGSATRRSRESATASSWSCLPGVGQQTLATLRWALGLSAAHGN